MLSAVIPAHNGSRYFLMKLYCFREEGRRRQVSASSLQKRKTLLPVWRG